MQATKVSRIAAQNEAGPEGRRSLRARFTDDRGMDTSSFNPQPPENTLCASGGSRDVSSRRDARAEKIERDAPRWNYRGNGYMSQPAAIERTMNDPRRKRKYLRRSFAPFLAMKVKTRETNALMITIKAK
jgi:hypothetical protein